MKKRKTVKFLVLLAVLLVLIIVYIVLRYHNEKAEEESVDASADEVFGIADSDIKSLSFSIEDQEVTFEKSDEGWIMKQDESYPVNDDQMTVLTDSLLSIHSNRTLRDVDDISQYGLNEPVDVIKVTDQEDMTTKITIGDTNSSTGDCYVYLNDDPSTVYTVDGDLSTVFSGNLMNYAQGEDFPSITADNIKKIEMNSQGKSFVLESDDTLISGWKVSDETGKTQESDITKANEVKSTVSGLSYTNYYEYDCKDYSVYGLDKPYAVIRIDYTKTEANEDDKEETVEQSVILSVGNEDGNGSRYTHIEGSTEVHSISDESISELLGRTLSDMENLSVSNIPLTSIDKLTVTYQNESHEFTMEEDEESNITYYMDEKETDMLAFSTFYNNLIGMTAQKTTDEEPAEKAEFSAVFRENDGMKVTVNYYPYDTNFYIADCDGKHYFVNKMDVRNLISKYEELF